MSAFPNALKESTHISLDQNAKWYFLKSKDNDLCAVMLFIDQDGNKFFTDFTRDEINALFEGWQEANRKADYN